MSTIAVNAITDASGGNTASINGATPTTDNLMGRNRIINGAMEIAQRGTAAVTASGSYPVDRFVIVNTTDGAFSAQQDSSAPAGFVKSLKFTTTTADASLAATQICALSHRIEGTNIADMGFGTANANTITVSFWVRSSLTGTFGGAIINDGFDRSYPFSYTISSADTWEYKTVTLAGDTTGTWLNTTGRGMVVNFSLAAGADRVGTAGSWVGANNQGVSGQVQVIGTLNATWYITGVQLEAGSVATSFERRSYGQELALCQRYAIKIGGGTSNNPHIAFGTGGNTTTALLFYYPPVTFRSTPSLASFSSLVIDDSNGSISISGLFLDTGGSSPAFIRLNANATGLIQFRPYFLRGTSSTGNLVLSAEL